MKKRYSVFSIVVSLGLLACIVMLTVMMKSKQESACVLPKYVTEKLMDIDGKARSGEPLEQVKGIVIHYTGIPDLSAAETQKAIENKGETSPHFIIGINGEVLLCIPLDEEASVSAERNEDTVAIELCHSDESGKLTEKSYSTLIKLTAWLCSKYGLTENNVLRHYDITGRECPLYFVENEDAWLEFLRDIKENIK